jgi:hypothetical protein
MVNFAVSASADCTWSASTNASWIAIQTRSGAGSASGAFVVNANGGSGRSGDVNVGGRTIAVSQDAAPAPGACPTSVDPGSVRVQASGQTVTFSVTASADCTWPVSTNASWIAVQTRSGAGSASGAFVVNANGGSGRSGDVNVGGRTISVSQDAAPAPCPASVEPGTVRVKAGGGTVTFTVSASADCMWSVSTRTPWIVIGTRSGAASATGTFVVNTNDGSSRSGEVNVSGRTISVTQDAAPPPCPTSVDPGSVRLTAVAQDVKFSITASADCQWSVGTDVGWIGIPTGSVVGSRTSGFSVKANDGSTARSGYVKIGGLSIAVTQDPATITRRCPVLLSTTSIKIPVLGGDFGFRVTVDAGCLWAIERAPDWIPSLTALIGKTATVTADVKFSVAKNSGPPRADTVVVNGQSFSISQDGVAVIGR